MADAVHIDWTEGPWIVVPADKAEHPWVIGAEDGTSLATCEPMGPWISPQEADEIARLIASAPELKANNNRLRILFDDIYAAWMAGDGDEVDRLLHTEVKPAAAPSEKRDTGE